MDGNTIPRYVRVLIQELYTVQLVAQRQTPNICPWKPQPQRLLWSICFIKSIMCDAANRNKHRWRLSTAGCCCQTYDSRDVPPRTQTILRFRFRVGLHLPRFSCSICLLCLLAEVKPSRHPSVENSQRNPFNQVWRRNQNLSYRHHEQAFLSHRRQTYVTILKTGPETTRQRARGTHSRVINSREGTRARGTCADTDITAL